MTSRTFDPLKKLSTIFCFLLEKTSLSYIRSHGAPLCCWLLSVGWGMNQWIVVAVVPARRLLITNFFFSRVMKTEGGRDETAETWGICHVVVDRSSSLFTFSPVKRALTFLLVFVLLATCGSNRALAASLEGTSIIKNTINNQEPAK
jgi:hypothetical protein